MMKRNGVIGLVAISLVLATSAMLAADKTKSEEAFDRLASLKGQWVGTAFGVKTTLTYILTANGSALMEECRPESKPEMITMFTIDGDHLLATHYCSAKNQPQMATAAITDAQKPLAFSLVRISGLKSPDAFHNTGLTVIPQGNDYLTQEWLYESHGKTGRNVFRFTRRREGATP